MFVSPGEVAFRIGSLSVYYYGIIMALAIITGIFVANKITKKYYPELDPELIYDIAPYIIIGGILGARIYYCLLSFNFYSKHPLEIIQIWHGGLSIQGAIAGGLILGIIYAKRRNLPILKLCDIFSYGAAIGQVIGRWGNFFNSEAFGLPTDLPWKLYIPYYKRPAEYMNYDFFHPTFLYESILDLIIFLILTFTARKLCKNHSGLIFSLYLILYSTARLFVEQIRIDSVLDISGIHIAQIASIITIIAASLLIMFIANRKEEF